MNEFIVAVLTEQGEVYIFDDSKDLVKLPVESGTTI